MRVAGVAWGLLLWGASACSGASVPGPAVDAGADSGAGTGEDGGADAAFAGSPRLPGPVAAPAPLELPCGAGFTDRSPGCDPSIPPNPACQPGETRTPSSGLRCARAASACEDGSFRGVAAPPEAVFVREGASGDGSETSPFGSLDAAWPLGRPVVIGPGTYEWPDGETPSLVVGTCPGEVIVRLGRAVSDIGALGDLRLVLDDAGAIEVPSGVTTEIAGAIIDGLRPGSVRVVGSLRVMGTTLTGASEPESSPVDPVTGILAVGSPGSLTLSRVSLFDLAAPALVASGRGTAVSLMDALVHGTRTTAPDPAPAALAATEGAALQLASVVVAESEGRGVSIDAGATTTWDDVVVADSGVLADAADRIRDDGTGLYVGPGSDAVLRRATILRGERAGIFLDSGVGVLDPGSGEGSLHFEATDLVVRDTRGEGFALGRGYGLNTAGAMTLQISP